MLEQGISQQDTALPADDFRVIHKSAEVPANCTIRQNQHADEQVKPRTMQPSSNFFRREWKEVCRTQQRKNQQPEVFCRVSQDFDGVFMEHEIPPVQQGKINLQIAYRVPLHPLF